MGHEEGIVAFGKDLDEAGNILFCQINNLRLCLAQLIQLVIIKKRPE